MQLASPHTETDSHHKVHEKYAETARRLVCCQSFAGSRWGAGRSGNSHLPRTGSRSASCRVSLTRPTLQAASPSSVQAHAGCSTCVVVPQLLQHPIASCTASSSQSERALTKSLQQDGEAGSRGFRAQGKAYSSAGRSSGRTGGRSSRAGLNLPGSRHSGPASCSSQAGQGQAGRAAVRGAAAQGRSRGPKVRPCPCWHSAASNHWRWL